MTTRMMTCAVVVVFAAVFACGGEERVGDNTADLRAAVEALRPLHRKLGKPGPGDWLACHKEPEQTFAAYLKSSPVTPTGTRTKLHILKIGEFTPKQMEVLALTSDFMAVYLNLPVVVDESLPLSAIPSKARRTHPSWGMPQILSTYVLDKVLKPRLPADAAAFIAFTASDLWPGEGWNFVFGQASLEDRVGVWSIYRNGDPAENPDEFKLCLRRTLKTAVHETCHMFSMEHCMAYECCMCGSNNREESDRHPLWMCPECVAKLCWATKADPIERYRKLKELCGRNGLKDEAAFYGASIDILLKVPPRSGR